VRSGETAEQQPASQWQPLLSAVATAAGLPRRLAAPLGVRPRSAAPAPAEQHAAGRADPTQSGLADDVPPAAAADTALAALHPAVPWPDLQHAQDLQVANLS
jgi:hypothetical protein